MNPTNIDRLTAGRVDAPGGLSARSRAASENELATDIHAAEDVIDPRSHDSSEAAKSDICRTLGRVHDTTVAMLREAVEGEGKGGPLASHLRRTDRRIARAKAALPLPIGQSIHEVSLTIEVPIMATPNTPNADLVEMAVRRVWQHIVDAMVEPNQTAYVDGCEAKIPDDLRGECERHLLAVGREIGRLNVGMQRSDDAVAAMPTPKEARALVSLGQGDFRHDITEGDVGGGAS